MLALRLARRAHAAVQFRRLLVALASGGTGLLLLCALGYALGHSPPHGAAALRLAWCLVPLAATAAFGSCVARSDPGTRPRTGLFAAGYGPVRLTLYAALTTALSCLLGSALALLCFLHLRTGLPGLPSAGAAGSLLAAGRPLPWAAVLVLLAAAPVTAGAASAYALRPSAPARPTGPSDDDGDAGAPEAVHRPRGLPWGVALLAVGLAVETYTSAAASGRHGLPLPGGLARGSLGVLAGWGLTALGLALAGPALTFACGRCLGAGRPGGLRLLAGRILQQEARRIGRPLGLLCAVASGAYAAWTLSAGGQPGAGPMTLLGGGVVAGCTVGMLAMAALGARQSRIRTTAALHRLGAPAGLLRTAVALRAGVLLALFAPLTWGVAELAALPLAG